MYIILVFTSITFEQSDAVIETYRLPGELQNINWQD